MEIKDKKHEHEKSTELVDPSGEEKKISRTLSSKQSIVYSSGILGQFIPSSLITAFLSIYWVFAVGLDAELVGYSTAAGSLANAFGAIFFGYLSDNKKPTKLGKRRIFILLGLPILVSCLILLWYVPHETEYFAERDGELFIYLTVLNIGFFLGFSCIRSSYLAMLPEQVEDDKERIKVSGQQGLFSILATVLGILLPMILMSKMEDPQEIYENSQDKEYLFRVLPILGILFGIIAIIFTLAVFFSINEDFIIKEANLDVKNQGKSRSIKQIFLNIIIPFRDNEYLKWLLASFFMNIAVRMMTKNLTPFFTYVLELEGNPFVYYLLAAVPFAVGGFIYWQNKAKNSGLKPAYLQSTTIIGISLGLTGSLLLIEDRLFKQIIAFIFIIGIISSLVGGYILPNPIISALSDEMPEELKESKKFNSAGNYFGSYLFMLNIANAIGDVILGWLMKEENARDPFIIGIIFPVCTIFFIISVGIFRKSKLNK